ncbi:protein of unknown function [Paraburkholderia kururiensis]
MMIGMTGMVRRCLLHPCCVRPHACGSWSWRVTRTAPHLAWHVSYAVRLAKRRKRNEHETKAHGRLRPRPATPRWNAVSRRSATAHFKEFARAPTRFFCKNFLAKVPGLTFAL